jgi:hypothetical protein
MFPLTYNYPKRGFRGMGRLFGVVGVEGGLHGVTLHNG